MFYSRLKAAKKKTQQRRMDSFFTITKKPVRPHMLVLDAEDREDVFVCSMMMMVHDLLRMWTVLCRVPLSPQLALSERLEQKVEVRLKKVSLERKKSRRASRRAPSHMLSLSRRYCELDIPSLHNVRIRRWGNK